MLHKGETVKIHAYLYRALVTLALAQMKLSDKHIKIGLKNPSAIRNEILKGFLLFAARINKICNIYRHVQSYPLAGRTHK
jgi:hypothetical protein